MATNSQGRRASGNPDIRLFKLKPGVYYEDVPWFRKEGVFRGTRPDQRGTIRLYAPIGAPDPPYIEVQSYWVTLAKD